MKQFQSAVTVSPQRWWEWFCEWLGKKVLVYPISRFLLDVSQKHHICSIKKMIRTVAFSGWLMSGQCRLISLFLFGFQKANSYFAIVWMVKRRSNSFIARQFIFNTHLNLWWLTLSGLRLRHNSDTQHCRGSLFPFVVI